MHFSGPARTIGLIGRRGPRLLPLALMLGVNTSASGSETGQADSPQPGCYDIAKVGPLVELKTAGRLSAVIAPARGAELVGLGYRPHGSRIELLYRGMDFCEHEGWDGKAPILWPATGRNFDAAAPGGLGWNWNGQDFPIAIHGFARDLPWRLIGQTAGRNEATAVMELTQTPQTLASYPFGFTFTLTYRLTGKQLRIEHEIVASPDNDGAMPFSIGNHMTFRQPLYGEGSATITTPAKARLLLDQSGKPVGKAPQLPLERVAATALGKETAVSLTDYPSAPWLRLDDPSGISILLSHRASQQPDGQSVQFNLWGNPALGFFSPEPWLGRQNSLAEGVGLVRLLPSQRFTWVITLRVTG